MWLCRKAICWSRRYVGYHMVLSAQPYDPGISPLLHNNWSANVGRQPKTDTEDKLAAEQAVTLWRGIKMAATEEEKAQML